MKKYLIGFLSVFLLIASIFGASSKAPRSPRPASPGDRPDRVLWV